MTKETDIISFSTLSEFFEVACSQVPKRDGYYIISVNIDNNVGYFGFPTLPESLGVIFGLMNITVELFKEGFIYTGVVIKGGDIIVSSISTPVDLL